MKRRRGSLLVCVLVCLGIASSIMLTAIHASLRERRQVLRELQMEQTRWVVDAGISKGKTKWIRDPSYTGETWQVSPLLNEHVTATIDISMAGTAPNRLTVTATIQGNEPNAKPTRRTKILELSDRDPPVP